MAKGPCCRPSTAGRGHKPSLPRLLRPLVIAILCFIAYIQYLPHPLVSPIILARPLALSTRHFSPSMAGLAPDCHAALLCLLGLKAQWASSHATSSVAAPHSSILLQSQYSVEPLPCKHPKPERQARECQACRPGPEPTPPRHHGPSRRRQAPHLGLQGGKPPQRIKSREKAVRGASPVRAACKRGFALRARPHRRGCICGT